MTELTGPPEEMDSCKRLEAFYGVLKILCELNREVPVIVEGKRDALALREIGLEGKIIQVHAGKNLYEFSEEIYVGFREVILLMDWDIKGETLMQTLGDYLSGLWERFNPLRESLKELSRNEIYELEQIPGLIERLKRECEG